MCCTHHQKLSLKNNGRIRSYNSKCNFNFIRFNKVNNFNFQSLLKHLIFSWIHSTLSRLNEVGELFGQFFKQLFAIVGFAAMNTSNRKSLLMALVFAIFLYYLALVQLHINSFLPFMMVILLLGSVVSILALMVISPTIAWIYLGFWILIFASMFYKNRKELFQWIPKRIKNVINVCHLTI